MKPLNAEKTPVAAPQSVFEAMLVAGEAVLEAERKRRAEERRTRSLRSMFRGWESIDTSHD